MLILDANLICDIISRHCKEKGYQIITTPDSNHIRLDIANFNVKAIMNVYFTNAIVVQGKASTLKEEFEVLKQKIETNPSEFLGQDVVEEKPTIARYVIMLQDLRAAVVDGLTSTEYGVTIDHKPSAAVEYRIRVEDQGRVATITQWENGTLLIQGKTNRIFDDVCDIVEKVCSPSTQEVAARFISSDEKVLDLFVARLTPQLLELAEGRARKQLGSTFDYLFEHDKNWFISSECLMLAGIPFPEYSPIVMPAAKALEGFAKKILTEIGLFSKDHFNKKEANFSALNDKTNSNRIAVCGKEKYMDTMLKKLSLSLDYNRNFMMHSDDASITKVSNLQDAEYKVNKIYEEVKEFFDYCKSVFSLTA